jgi:CRP-like cAMP-binding protein
MFIETDSLARAYGRFDQHQHPGPKTVALRAHKRVFLQAVRRDAFRIIDGCVVTQHAFGGNRRQILDIFGPGRIFSYAMVSLEGSDAEALVPTKVKTLDMHSEQALNEYQSTIHLSLQRMRAHAVLLGKKSAAERVACALLDLSQQLARPGQTRVGGRLTLSLYLTRGELADYLGLTHETVSRILSRLKSNKIIAFTRPEIVTIVDGEALETPAAGRRDCDHPQSSI